MFESSKEEAQLVSQRVFFVGYIHLAELVLRFHLVVFIFLRTVLEFVTKRMAHHSFRRGILDLEFSRLTETSDCYTQ